MNQSELRAMRQRLASRSAAEVDDPVALRIAAGVLFVVVFVLMMII